MTGDRRSWALISVSDKQGLETLARGLVRKGRPVKVLARGEIGRAMTVRAHAFSEAARAKIEAAGGRAEIVAE